MTIYIVSPYESSVEGRGTRNIHLANILGRNNSVKFLTTRFSHTNKKFHSKAAFDNTDEVWLPTIAYSKNLSLKRMLAHWVTASVFLWYTIWRLKKGDVVIVSSIPPELILTMSMVARLKRASLVLDVRDIWPDAFPMKGRVATIFSYYCKALYKLSSSIKSPDQMVYVAPSFLKWINRYFPVNVRKTFIPLGYDEKRWNFPKTPENYTFVYIGFLESQFDLSFFLKELCAAGWTNLAVVGSGSRLSCYIDIVAGSDLVDFKGILPPIEAAGIVRSSKIGLLPVNLSAQMPNKLFDYIGAGIPILCIGKSDAASFVVENSIGWAVPFERESIAHFLRTLNSDDIVSRAENVRRMRESVSKGNLYKAYSELVGSLYNPPKL